MRRAFTLVELLVVVAIMGIMVTAAVVSLTAGEGAARVRGAVRDVYAAIRHARSTALVTQQPTVVTYSTTRVDGETVAKVEIHSAKLIETTGADEQIETVTGEIVVNEEEEEAKAKAEMEAAKAKANAKTTAKTSGTKTAGTTETADEGKQGESIEDILFAPVDDSVVKGMRVKVVMGQELTEVVETTTRKPKISVFSNVDYLLNRFKSSQQSAASSTDKTDGNAATSSAKTDKNEKAEAEQDQEPVSVVWDTNGRVDPHCLWVYPDGKKPEDGMMIRVDRFGAVKVLNGSGKEEDL